MFVSIYYIAGFINLRNGYANAWELCDSDFRESFHLGDIGQSLHRIGVILEVAKIYEIRKLNVAKNLFLATQYIMRHYPYHSSINSWLAWNNEKWPELTEIFKSKYLPGIQKYLILQ